jgi:predicted nucleotidyltransferase
MSGLVIPQSLRRVVGRYVRAFAPERIVLFGSYAKGTMQSGSDLDLLVIVRVEDRSASSLRRAHQLAADCFPTVDVAFATVDDVENAALDRNPFLLSVLGTGVTVYSREANGTIGNIRGTMTIGDDRKH